MPVTLCFVIWRHNNVSEQSIGNCRGVHWSMQHRPYRTYQGISGHIDRHSVVHEGVDRRDIAGYLHHRLQNVIQHFDVS